jgi:hypothetical protein
MNEDKEWTDARRRRAKAKEAQFDDDMQWILYQRAYHQRQLERLDRDTTRLVRKILNHLTRQGKIEKVGPDLWQAKRHLALVK